MFDFVENLGKDLDGFRKNLSAIMDGLLGYDPNEVDEEAMQRISRRFFGRLEEAAIEARDALNRREHLKKDSQASLSEADRN